MGKRVAHLVCLLAVTAGVGSTVPKSIAQDCPRTCLAEMLDQYLEAVIAHNPSQAPLFPGFRQTENAVVVRPGTGVWETVTSLGQLQRRFFDPVSGQAGYFGLIEEGETPAISTLRLRVSEGQITEAEWVISRMGDDGLNGPLQAGQGGVWDAHNLVTNPPPATPLGGSVRLERNAMIAVANGYFDGITSHDGSIIRAWPGCTRIENGVTMTGPGSRGGPTSDCTSGLETINISNVSARRYPLVDEEAGVVLAMVVFQRNPGTTARRNLLTEWFLIEGKQIRMIYAAMFYPVPEAPVPNWPPFDPNWPLNAETSN